MSLRNSDFIGAAKPLDDIDLPKLGKLLGVGEDELHAFIDVETSGGGFDHKGRPKMLFEPHVFYRNLSGKQRDEAVAAGLAYSRWGQKPYPADSYPRLKRAMEINEAAALKSASWGLGQVLGENYAAVNYQSIEAFVRAMMADEENHLRASVDFILHNHLDDELRAHAWKAFARGYNGPRYAVNRYDQQMADAFAKWSGIRDTPLEPSAPPIVTPTHVSIGAMIVAILTALWKGLFT